MSVLALIVSPCASTNDLDGAFGLFQHCREVDKGELQVGYAGGRSVGNLSATDPHFELAGTGGETKQAYAQPIAEEKLQHNAKGFL